MKSTSNKHKLFLIQLGLGILCFIFLAFLTKTTFYNSAKINSYLSINDGVKEMASSSSDLLDSLIKKNEVTFDPTSGKELSKVFKNLKPTEKPKFLIVGSSQLRVVQGQNSLVTYKSIVSKKMENISRDKYQTYNLSLGGMTIPEKLIVSKKASTVLKPNNILIAVTPWDCLADKIRPGVSEVEKETYSLKTDSIKEDLIVEKELVFPLNINNKISNSLENSVDENVTIYSKRIGIKQWLNDELVSVIVKTKDSLKQEINNPVDIMADYWLTLNQDLDNKSAWDNTVVKSGKRSLKIVNADKTSSKWLGELISLKTPTKTIEFEGWSKADSVSAGTKLYALDFLVTFEDNSIKWHFKNLKFKKGTHDWDKVNTTVTFDKKVKSIKPHLLFYGGTGTVWFDDIKAFPIVDGVKQGNIIPNSGAELELKERLNVSYSYKKEEWKTIKENMFSVVDYLKSNTAQNKYLLLTPFWHTDKKSAYPQKDQYLNLVSQVKSYCKQNNIKCIDASYILNKNNFGVYKNGSVRDKIDVLHFDAQAHEVLAKYIIKNL